MTNLPGTSFSPYQLRPLLRELLAPGERVIGWATVQLRTGIWGNIDHIGLAIMPGVGQVLAGVLGRQQRRFMLITDRRLVMTIATARAIDPGASGVTLDAPLASLGIRRLIETGHFALRYDPAEPEAVFEVIEPSRSADKRFSEALELLAVPTPSRSDAEPSPGV